MESNTDLAIEALGKEIKELRNEKGYTLSQLSEEIKNRHGKGISIPYLSQIERGKLNNIPSLDTIRKIAEALEIPSSHLLAKADQLTEEEESKMFRYSASRFTNSLYRLISAIRPLLNELEEEGAFLSIPGFEDDEVAMFQGKDSDGTLENYFGPVAERVFELKGELKNISNSPFSGLYDAILKGVFPPDSVSRHIEEKSSGNPVLVLDEERQRVEKDLYHLEQNKEVVIEKVDSFFDLFFRPTPDEHRFNEKLPNNAIKQEFHKFPVNNLYAHLTDPLNRKLYKDIVLSESDRENIIRLINSYLLHKYVDSKNGEERDKFIEDFTKETTVVMEWEKQKAKMKKSGSERDVEEE